MLTTLMVPLLVTLIIVALVYWVITVLPLPEPVRTVAIVILVVGVMLCLLKFLGLPF